jgi:hypothetical protein
VTRALLVVLLAATAGRASAAPHKVFVLPLDGDADPALRGKLADDIRELARAGGDDVAAGDATFADTAAAVGCAPADASCAGKVVATLGVDELVWGTATTKDGATTVVVHSAGKQTPTRSVSATLQPGEGAERARPVIAPFFGQPVPNDAPAQPQPAETPGERKNQHWLGLSLAVGGGVLLVVAIVMWGVEKDQQGQIDNAPTRTLADLQSLNALENRAASYAVAGNVLFVLGLAAGGAGAYFLWRDHRRRGATIAPAPIDHGAAVVVGGRW